MGSKKLVMWLFIISDSLTFSVLLLSYSYLRLANADWPRPFPFSPSIVFSTIMTVVLLFSSLTMVMAVAAAARGRRGTAVKWILGTMAGGAAFIGLHLTEWMHLIEAGPRPGANPWGSPLFGAVFFGVTGSPMTHGAAGVCSSSLRADRPGPAKIEPGGRPATRR